MSKQIKWTKARRKMLQEIEVAEVVNLLRRYGRRLSKASLKEVVAEYVKQVNPPARPDPRQSETRDAKGRPLFDAEDSETLSKRIAEDAIKEAQKR